MARGLPRYGFSVSHLSPSGGSPSVSIGCGATSPWLRAVEAAARIVAQTPAVVLLDGHTGPPRRNQQARCWHRSDAILPPLIFQGAFDLAALGHHARNL